MNHTRDYMLIFLVTFMSVAVILPDDSIMSGIDRKFLVFGLLIVVTIALAHYSKFVVVTAVFIAAIGANLPSEIAQALNVDPNIFMGVLVALLVLPIVNQILKLPTGLDKPQGFPSARHANARIPEIGESKSANASDDIIDDTGNLADTTGPA